MTEDRARSIWGNDSNAGAAAQRPDLSETVSAAPCGLFPAKKVTLRIPGQPQPGGSKRAFTPKGWKRAVIVDANPKAKDWKRTVQVFAQQGFDRPVINGPVRTTCTFYMARPKWHFGTRGLKANSPAYHTIAPDGTKLWRSTEDALKGIVWVDDARVADQRVVKLYTNNGWTGAVIEVEEIQG